MEGLAGVVHHDGFDEVGMSYFLAQNGTGEGVGSGFVDKINRVGGREVDMAGVVNAFDERSCEAGVIVVGESDVVASGVGDAADEPAECFVMSFGLEARILVDSIFIDQSVFGPDGEGGGTVA